MESKCSQCPMSQQCASANFEKPKVNNIKNKVLVLSGKGGVGKSTVAANIAASLSLQGYKTGLLDIDLHGPSIPKLMGLEGQKPEMYEDLLVPVEYSENLKVMSTGLLLDELDSALIWRGPVKQQIISQFVNDVKWDELDYLIIDCPPGTGDEPLSAISALEEVSGAVIVTTPQQLSVSDVRRSVNFCKEMEVPILGVIENMSGYVCPHSGQIVNIFKTDGGKHMAEEMKVPFLGKIPLTPEIVESCDEGKPAVIFGNDEAVKNIFTQAVTAMVEAIRVPLKK